MSTTHIAAALRRLVIARAAGRCEYCRVEVVDSLGPPVAGFRGQLDHVVSERHGGATVGQNLALACVLCNRAKGATVAALDDDGRPERLFDPRRDRWGDHFRLDAGRIEPQTSIGVVTARFLRLNTRDRLTERRLMRAAGTYPAE